MGSLISRIRRVGWGAAALAAVWLLAAPASAQLAGSGVLTGTVKDAQGAVLPGVTVTATSPALIGSQVSVSETSGVYRIPALPAGTYALKFELAGFKTTTRSGIVLAANQTLSLDLALPLASVQENVTVSAAAPVVDVQSTAVGDVLNSAKLTGVPTSTDLWGSLAQVAGVRMRGFDVGGSHKMQQTAYDSFGIRGQNRVILNGIDTTEGDGGAGNYVDYYMYSEVAVTAAGGDVSMNTPGAMVNQTIKSGGNTFKGLENITYEGRNFVGNNKDAATEARGFTGQPNLLYWEGHVDLGGPIVKDKLWFYAAYNHFKINKLQSGIPESLATNLAVFNDFTTKETYKASSKDTIVGFYNYNKKDEPLRGLSATVGPETAMGEFSPSWNYNGQYQRLWSNRLFTEFSVGLYGYDFPFVPNVDYRSHPPTQDSGTGYETGAGWNSSDSKPSKPQVFGNGTYFLPTSHGNHDLKVGFEWLNDRYNSQITGLSGPILYLPRNGQPDEITLSAVGENSTLGKTWTGSNDVDRRAALYFQDRWTTGPVTITAGVRYDRQRLFYESGKTDPILKDIFTATTTPGKTLFTRNTVVPRLGVSWDPTGNGQSVIKAFYGRYYFNFADAFTEVDPVTIATKTYKFLDPNGNGTYDGPQELGTQVDSTGGVDTTYDPNIKTPYTDEFDLSYQRQFWGESSYRIAYVRKMTRNDYATINTAREGQFTVPVSIPVTLKNYGVDGATTVGTQTFNVNDIPDAVAGQFQDVIQTMPASVDAGAANYDTLAVSFNKRFSKGLFLDTAFDYSWRNELRRTSASNNPQSSDPIATGYFQNPYPTVSNRQHITYWGAHVSGRYEFKYDIGIGANFQVQSGWPYARLISVRLPNAGTQKIFMTDINQNRSDATPLLGIRLDKAITFAGGRRITFLADVFNILNSNAVVNFNLTNGSSFNQINGTLDPRTAEIGLRFEF